MPAYQALGAQFPTVGPASNYPRGRSGANVPNFAVPSRTKFPTAVTSPSASRNGMLTAGGTGNLHSGSANKSATPQMHKPGFFKGGPTSFPASMSPAPGVSAPQTKSKSQHAIKPEKAAGSGGLKAALDRATTLTEKTADEVIKRKSGNNSRVLKQVTGTK